MKTPILAILATAAIVAVFFAYGPPVIAADDAVASATVSYDDLELASPVDAKILLDRINRAADRLCETEAISHGSRQCIASGGADAARRYAWPIMRAAYGGRASRRVLLAEARPH
jgi:UrcA family protein